MHSGFGKRKSRIQNAGSHRKEKMQGFKSHRKGKMQGFKSQRKEKAQTIDYQKTVFDRRALAANTLLYLLLDLLVCHLFFRAPAAGILLLPGVLPFLKERKKSAWRSRKARIRTEFLTGIRFAASSLQAGYSVENAFTDALLQLRRIYPQDSFAVREFGRIKTALGLNRTMESILEDLAARSHLEEIDSFTDAFSTARKSGGDMARIIANTAQLLQQKEETQREVETALAGKQMEYALMSVIPMFILIYVNVTSPGFLDPLYGTVHGAAIMSVALGIYAAAFIWGRRILGID